uniref:Aminotransferase class V domain-containing protein n=1 Tax=Romanomermis culicivorax TaxID=13658 RepID=A0A915I236_ROMCU
EAFGTVAYAINHYAKKSGSKTERIELRFPTQEEYILSTLEKVLKKNHGRVRLVSISHISSTPSVLLPVQAIQAICRRYKALLVVDGAHAFGQIELNLTRLDPDIYVANGHKWFFSSRGSGIVYVKKNVRKLLQFSTIPHYFRRGKNSFIADESNVYDFSALLTMATALEFRRLVGGEGKIAQYNRKLASKAADILTQKWKTNILIRDYARQNLSMINVALPLYHHMLVRTVVERLMQQQRTFLIYFYHAGYYYARI